MAWPPRHADRQAISSRRYRAHCASNGQQGSEPAFSDVHYLSRALATFYRNGEESLLESYSNTALRRVWGAIRLSWWLTTLLHVFPDETKFDRKVRENEYAHLASSEAALANLAQQFVGLPL
jgi:p-hydroxybenzoate 3-monooxygenase